LKLRPIECRILGFLVNKDKVGRRDAIYTAVYGGRPECDQPAVRLVDVYICRIRAALRGCDIKMVTVFGLGWAIAAADKAKLNAWLKEKEDE
jgi:two-component system cell cycle response regulator CtrA